MALDCKRKLVSPARPGELIQVGSDGKEANLMEQTGKTDDDGDTTLGDRHGDVTGERERVTTQKQE